MKLHRKNLQLYWRKVPQRWLWGVPVANTDPEEDSHSQGIFGCFWILGLAKAEEGSVLHRQNSNVTVSMWSLTWIYNEERLQGCPRTLQLPIRKVFMPQIFAFAWKGRWVPAADPAYGIPSPCLGWGNWFCMGTHLQFQLAAASPASALLPCTVCTGFSPASSRKWELIYPPWLIFLHRNRNQIPQENDGFWKSLCLIYYRFSCSPWQCTVRVLLAFNIWWPWVTCAALAP